MGSSFLPNQFAPWMKGIPIRKHWRKLKDARSYFVGLYIYGCRFFTKRQPINQPEKMKLCWRVFHFLRLHTLEPVTLQKLFHWPTKLDDQRTFNSFAIVRNTMISLLGSTSSSHAMPDLNLF